MNLPHLVLRRLRAVGCECFTGRRCSFAAWPKQVRVATIGVCWSTPTVADQDDGLPADATPVDE